MREFGARSGAITPIRRGRPELDDDGSVEMQGQGRPSHGRLWKSEVPGWTRAQPSGGSAGLQLMRGSFPTLAEDARVGFPRRGR